MSPRGTYWSAAKSAARSVSGALDNITENATIQTGAKIGSDAATKAVAMAHSAVFAPTAVATGFATTLQSKFSAVASGISRSTDNNVATTTIGPSVPRAITGSKMQPAIPVAALASAATEDAGDLTASSDGWSDSE